MLAFQTWTHGLTIQMQSVLALALRGPDGLPKFHPSKHMLRIYRSVVLNAAKYGRPLKWREGDNFMNNDALYDDKLLREHIKAYFNVTDEIPKHAYLHFMHGCQIIGFMHPDGPTADAFRGFYNLCCDDMHINPETHQGLLTRLGDWNQVHWD